MSSIATSRNSSSISDFSLSSSGVYEYSLPNYIKMETKPKLPPVARLEPRGRFFMDRGDITFKVESTYFRVHSYFFERDSPVYCQLQSEEYSSTFSIESVTALDFERFLTVLYPSKFNAHDATSTEEWTSILRVSVLLEFQSIRDLAIKELGPIASPIDKIMLGRQYLINHWLRDAYFSVCTRPETLSREEGRRLGVDEVVDIMRARQLLAPTPTSDMDINGQYNIIDTVFTLGPASDTSSKEERKSLSSPSPRVTTQSAILSPPTGNASISGCDPNLLLVPPVTSPHSNPPQIPIHLSGDVTSQKTSESSNTSPIVPEMRALDIADVAQELITPTGSKSDLHPPVETMSVSVEPNLLAPPVPHAYYPDSPKIPITITRRPLPLDPANNMNLDGKLPPDPKAEEDDAWAVKPKKKQRKGKGKK